MPQQIVELQQQIAACSNLSELLVVLARGLGAVLPVRDRVSVVFLEPDGEWMRIYRVLPVQDELPDPLPRVRVEGTPVGQVVREGAGRVVADVRTDPNITFGHASHGGIRSTVSVPLRIGGRVVGAMNAGSSTPGTCTEEMLRELEGIASVVGPALYAAEQIFVEDREREAHGGAPVEAGDWPTIDELQRRYICRVLELCDGIIEGPDGAAKLLGLRPSTLRSRMKRLDISARPMRKKGPRRH